MKHVETGKERFRGREGLRYVGYIILLLTGVWALVGYLATIPVVGNHPYWRNLRARPKDYGLTAEDVSFSSLDGIPLKGWYISATGVAHGTIILAHGINGNRSDMLPRSSFLVRDGYNALLLDLRDHGESGGNYAGSGYMESLDVLGGVQYLQTRGQRGPIVAMGHSYGAVAALYSASESADIAAVIADSAFISFEDMVRRATILLAQDPERSFWERLGLRLAGFRAAQWAVMPMFYLRTGVWMNGREGNSLVAIAHIGQRPILFIAGARDAICPSDNTRLMYKAALSPNKALLVVADAEHDSTFTTAPQLYESTAVRFLEKVVNR